MRWKDFLTTEYKKLDITLEKASDVQFFLCYTMLILIRQKYAMQESVWLFR